MTIRHRIVAIFLAAGMLGGGVAASMPVCDFRCYSHVSLRGGAGQFLPWLNPNSTIRVNL